MQHADQRDQKKWLRRIAWLIGIWLAGIAALALVAYGLRIFMGLAGMTT